MTNLQSMCVALALIVCSSLLSADDKVTFESLQAVAKTMLDEKAVTVVEPSLQFDGNEFTLTIPVVSEFDDVAVSPEIAKLYPVLVGCLELELQRRHLFTRTDDLEFMTPFFRSEEGKLRAALAIAKRHQGDMDSLTRKLDALPGGAIQEGLEAWAKRRGYVFDGAVGPAEIATTKTLIAKPGARIYLCLNTRYLLAKVSGKAEESDEFPWQEYRHGDRVQIAGTVRIRVVYQGNSSTFVRDVPFQGDRLPLPVQ